MNEFAREMTERVERTSGALHEASRTGEDYLVEVRLGELESLVRLAHDHGLDVPDAVAALARHGQVEDVELPAGTPSPTGPILIDVSDERSAAYPG